MTQNQLNQLVADATGEDVCEIESRGFSLADPLEIDFDPEPYAPPRIVDWDRLDVERNVPVFDQRPFRRVA